MPRYSIASMSAFASCRNIAMPKPVLVAGPSVAYVSFPGFARARSASSRKFRAGTPVCTTKPNGTCATRPIATKSFSRVVAQVRLRCRRNHQIARSSDQQRVPIRRRTRRRFGADLSPGPGRLSTVTATPSSFSSASATRRATLSVGAARLLRGDDADRTLGPRLRIGGHGRARDGCQHEERDTRPPGRAADL
jgi:hypothetical protein